MRFPLDIPILEPVSGIANLKYFLQNWESDFSVFFKLVPQSTQQASIVSLV